MFVGPAVGCGEGLTKLKCIGLNGVAEGAGMVGRGVGRHGSITYMSGFHTPRNLQSHTRHTRILAVSYFVFDVNCVLCIEVGVERRETSFKNDRPKKTQVLTLLRGRLALLEAIGQEEANQSCSLNTPLLLVRRASQVEVEPGPKMISEFLVIRVVTPKVSACGWGPKHDLEPSQRHPKRTNLGASPVTDALNPPRGFIHVDVVLEEIGVVRHERPTLGEEVWQLGDDLVKHRVKALRKSLAQLLELCQVLVE